MQGWTEGPRSHLSQLDAEHSISWEGGAKFSWGVEAYDLATGSPKSLSVEFIDGSVDWSYRVPNSVTGRADLEASVRRTAVLNVVGDILPDVFNTMFKIYLEMSSGNSITSKWYLGSFVASLPPFNFDGKLRRWTLELADKTHYWDQRKIKDPKSISINQHALLYVQTLLFDVFQEGVFDFPNENRFLDEPLFVEKNSSYLEIFNLVLEATGFEPLTTNPDGLAKTRVAEDFFSIPIEHVYSTEQNSTVLEQVSIDPLLANAPNVLRFVAQRGPSLPVEGNGIYTIYNLNVGPGSINNRGYEIPETVEVEANNQAELESIALRDANRFFMGGGERVSITTGINPRHDDRDVIAVYYPDVGLDSLETKWAVTSWMIPLSSEISSENDVTMSIEAEKLWTPGG